MGEERKTKMTMAETYEPMSDGLVKMILKTAGFKSPDEVRDAVKEVVILPRVLTEKEKKQLESRRKASRECKRRAREREKEEKRQQQLVNENNTIDT